MTENKKSNKNVQAFYTYIKDGIPETTSEHNTLNDAKYGYSKQVFVNTGNNNLLKLYSSTCNKLPFNQA